MTINFIGQGLKEGKTVGKYLNTSFKDKRFNKFLGFSAYSTTGGVKQLIPALKLAKLHFEEIKFFIGIDDKISTKEVFEIFLGLDIDSYVFHEKKHDKRKVIFHPKIYIFEGKRENRIILGSSNLTLNGLFDQNIEASVVVEFGVDDIRGYKFLNQIKSYFKSIINLETENVKKIDHNSLEELVNEGFIIAEKDRKQKPKNGNDLTENSTFFPEREAISITVNDVNGEIRTSERTNNGKANPQTKDKNPLNPQYLKNWHLHFEALKEFKEKFSHTVLPSEFEDEILVEWSRKQKALYNEGIIPKEHKDLLNGIDFYWGTAVEWNSERAWDKRYEEFEAYYLKYKTFSVSLKHDKSLSSWVITQRQEKHLLLPHQTKKMDALDPNWKLSAEEINNNSWLEKLVLLEQYKKENGDCNVPQDNKLLGRWVGDQRTKKRRGLMIPERQNLLESFDFIWDMGDYKFQQDLERLIKYKKRFGNFDVPLDFEEDKQLGIFVFGLKNRGTIPEKTQKLDDLGFNWEKHYNKSMNITSGYISKDWKDRVAKLKNLSLKGLDVNNIFVHSEDDKDIKDWITRQQKRYRENELKPEQVKLLEDAGVKLEKVSSQDQRWASFYDLLVSYKAEYGDARVPTSFDEELGNWVSTQRKSRRQGIIDQYKIDKLNELDFEWYVGNSNKKKKDPSV